MNGENSGNTENSEDLRAKYRRLDEERLERMRQREIAEKNKTPEEKEHDRLARERMSDLDKVVDGKMSFDDFKKKWNE